MINNSVNIFNSTLAASAISVACELKVLDELQENGFIHIKNFCQDRDLHLESMEGILSILCCFDICEATNNKNVFKKGSLFADIYHTKGFFLWLIRGYGHLLQNLPSIVKNENRAENFVKRDGKYIAMASHDQGSRLVDPYFEEVLNELPYAVVADLGCGSAERLINLAKQRPSMGCIGIDINPDAVKLAQRAVQAEGLEEQVTVLQGDMRKLTARPEFSDVDTLFSFFCGHDLWPWENCLQVMRNLHTVFPKVKRFLLCDTYRSNVVPSSKVPIFTLGFEFTHAVMGQYIPSLTDWMALFAESGWNCVKRKDAEVPFSTIFDLRPESL